MSELVFDLEGKFRKQENPSLIFFINNEHKQIHQKFLNDLKEWFKVFLFSLFLFVISCSLSLSPFFFLVSLSFFLSQKQKGMAGVFFSGRTFFEVRPKNHQSLQEIRFR